MNDEERQHLEELLRTNHRRLRHLEKQEAVYGLSTAPQIFIEIEEIKAKIAKIEVNLASSSISLLKSYLDNKLTVFEYCDQTVDYDFSVLPQYTKLELEDTKKKRRYNLLDRWELVGNETAADIAQKIENHSLTLEQKSNWISLIEHLRMVTLSAFLLNFIRNNHTMITCSPSYIESRLFEHCFYALGEVAEINQINEILDISQYIARPSRLRKISASFSHLLFAIIRTNFYINWRFGNSPDFNSRLNEWMIEFPDEVISRLRESAENVYEKDEIFLSFNPPIKSRVTRREVSKSFTEFLLNNYR